MSFDNVTSGHQSPVQFGAGAQSTEGTGKPKGHIHRATGDEIKPTTKEIASKALNALKSAVSNLDVSKHIQGLKGLSKSVEQLKSAILNKIFPKNLLSSLPLRGSGTKSQMKDLMGSLSHLKGSINLMDRHMEPKVTDLMGDARDIEHKLGSWSTMNEMLTAGSKLPSGDLMDPENEGELVTPKGARPSQDDSLLDELLALLPDRTTLTASERSRLKSDTKLERMETQIQQNLLSGLRSSMGMQEPTPPSTPSSSPRALPPGNPFAPSPLQERAASLKFLTPDEVKAARKEISDRLDVGKKIHVNIQDTKSVVQEATKRGLVDAGEAKSLIQGLDFVGQVADKDTAVAKQLSQNLDNWTIPAHR